MQVNYSRHALNICVMRMVVLIMLVFVILLLGLLLHYVVEGPAMKMPFFPRVLPRRQGGSRLSAHGLMASRPEIATAVAATAVGAVGIACWLKFHQPSAEQHEGEDENGQCRMGIQELSQQIQEQLKTRKPRHIDGVEPSMYKLPPFIPKSTWTVLGDELRRCETLDVTEVPGERFMTLRLDGSGFSKLTRRMTSLGVFSAGYSHEFADVMRECCQSLMTKFSAICGQGQKQQKGTVKGCFRVPLACSLLPD